MKNENLIRPNYYKAENGLEVIDVIQAFDLDFCLGNTIKYVLRAGKKDKEAKEKDLRKAITNLELELKHLQSKNGNLTKE